jgi:hypothetical protein
MYCTVWTPNFNFSDFANILRQNQLISFLKCTVCLFHLLSLKVSNLKYLLGRHSTNSFTPSSIFSFSHFLNRIWIWSWTESPINASNLIRSTAERQYTAASWLRWGLANVLPGLAKHCIHFIQNFSCGQREACYKSPSSCCTRNRRPSSLILTG